MVLQDEAEAYLTKACEEQNCVAASLLPLLPHAFHRMYNKSSSNLKQSKIQEILRCELTHYPLKYKTSFIKIQNR